MEFLDVLIGFGLNTVLASLVPTAIAGIVIKIQRSRRAYPRGTEGEKELARDCNVWLVGLNLLFLVWSYISGTAVDAFSVRVLAVALFVYVFYDRPKRLIALPESVLAVLKWIGETGDQWLERIPGYQGLKQLLLTPRWAKGASNYWFSGKEIPTMKKGQQLLLAQTQFTCHSCGSTRDYTHLGDAMQDGRGQVLYFCDKKQCRIEARNLYSKELMSWRRKSGVFVS